MSCHAQNTTDNWRNTYGVSSTPLKLQLLGAGTGARHQAQRGKLLPGRAAPRRDIVRSSILLIMAATAPASKGDLLIYAELLTNIRQITVKTSLPTPADHTTVAEIFDEGRKFRISHDGATGELVLPATAPVKGTLPHSHKGSVDLTWRLPLRPVRVPERQFLPENQQLPWSASDIKQGSAITCRGCGQLFIDNGAVNVWKDLPSENWAEMMEFWHCHKPVEHNQPENGSLQNRGYGAASAITAQTGVGFVDITSFLFAEQDCKSLKVSSKRSWLFCCTSASWGNRRWPSQGSSLSMSWSSIQFPYINL